MTGCLPTIHWFDRWDKRLGVVRPDGEVVHTEELNGDDVLSFHCRCDVGKGDRLVWRDGDHGWREHVVTRTSLALDGLVHVRAEGSLCELAGDYLDQVYVHKADALKALQMALEVTRWGVEVEDAGDAQVNCWFYHTDALRALRRLADMLGLDVSPRISVGPTGVLTRVLVAMPRLGGWHGARFEYGRNLVGCRRTVLEEPVVTALYGFGAGLPVVDEDGTWHGGYSRKLTLESVNSGVNWVGDDEACERWGRPGTDGVTKEHVFGDVVFSDCTDPEELLRLTREELSRRCVPRVTYVVDAACIEGACPELGDDVLVVDPLFAGGRVVERCVRRERTFGQTLSCQLTLGVAERDLYAIVEDVKERLDEVEGSVADVSDEIGVVGGEVFPPAVEPEPEPGPEEPEPGPEEPEEPEPVELWPRALLLDDGTLEFTCLTSEASPTGGAVLDVFEAAGGYETFTEVPWHARIKDVRAVRFDASFGDSWTTSLSYWFYTATNLVSVAGLEHLSGITQMDYTFCSCSSLASLDLRGMGLGERLNLKMTFGACTALERIVVDAGWTLPALSDKYATFHNCTRLVGGNGTTYSSSRISGDYMRIDTEGNAGYLTAL